MYKKKCVPYLYLALDVLDGIRGLDEDGFGDAFLEFDGQLSLAEVRQVQRRHGHQEGQGVYCEPVRDDDTQA